MKNYRIFLYRVGPRIIPQPQHHMVSQVRASIPEGWQAPPVALATGTMILLEFIIEEDITDGSATNPQSKVPRV